MLPIPSRRPNAALGAYSPYFLTGTAIYQGSIPLFPKPSSHETRLFRDKVIENLPAYLNERYPQGARIICHGCSGGHEVYSLAAKLIEVCGDSKKAKKLFQIEAHDLHQDVISFCNEGHIILPGENGNWRSTYLFEVAFTNAQELKGNNLFHAKVFYPTIRNDSLYICRVCDELRGMVTFSQENVLDGAEKINPKDDKPVIFMFRNAWFNLSQDNKFKLAKTLSSNLPKDSLVVNGESEIIDGCDTREALSVNGFVIFEDLERRLFEGNQFQKPSGYVFRKKEKKIN